jgi:hypothetical protein
VSGQHWYYGAIGRLRPGETVVRGGAFITADPARALADVWQREPVGIPFVYEVQPEGSGLRVIGAMPIDGRLAWRALQLKPQQLS